MQRGIVRIKPSPKQLVDPVHSIFLVIFTSSSAHTRGAKHKEVNTLCFVFNFLHHKEGRRTFQQNEEYFVSTPI